MNRLPALHWCVHVLGADDVMPAKNRHDAMIQAQVINAGVMDHIDQHDEQGITPTVWAVPTSYEHLGLRPPAEVAP